MPADYDPAGAGRCACSCTAASARPAPERGAARAAEAARRAAESHRRRAADLRPPERLGRCASGGTRSQVENILRVVAEVKAKLQRRRVAHLSDRHLGRRHRRLLLRAARADAVVVDSAAQRQHRRAAQSADTAPTASSTATISSTSRSTSSTASRIRCIPSGRWSRTSQWFESLGVTLVFRPQAGRRPQHGLVADRARAVRDIRPRPSAPAASGEAVVGNRAHRSLQSRALAGDQSARYGRVGCRPRGSRLLLRTTRRRAASTSNGRAIRSRRARAASAVHAAPLARRVDFAKPVVVRVNGKELFRGPVKKGRRRAREVGGARPRSDHAVRRRVEGGRAVKRMGCVPLRCSLVVVACGPQVGATPTQPTPTPPDRQRSRRRRAPPRAGRDDHAGQFDQSPDDRLGRSARAVFEGRVPRRPSPTRIPRFGSHSRRFATVTAPIAVPTAPRCFCPESVVHESGGPAPPAGAPSTIGYVVGGELQRHRGGSHHFANNIQARHPRRRSRRSRRLDRGPARQRRRQHVADDRRASARCSARDCSATSSSPAGATRRWEYRDGASYQRQRMRCSAWTTVSAAARAAARRRAQSDNAVAELRRSDAHRVPAAAGYALVRSLPTCGLSTANRRSRSPMAASSISQRRSWPTARGRRYGDQVQPDEVIADRAEPVTRARGLAADGALTRYTFGTFTAAHGKAPG